MIPPRYVLEDAQGRRTPLPPTFTGPLSLPAPALEGERAPGYDAVIHSDDGLPTVPTWSLSGYVTGVTRDEVDAKLDTLALAVQGAVKVWDFGKFRKVQGGLLHEDEYKNPLGTRADLVLIFRLASVRRFNADGTLAPR